MVALRCGEAWQGVPVANLAGSSKLLRAMNSSAALSLLFERGRLTRGELRDATGLSKPTVSDALRRLVEADLALVVGHVRGGPGPNAEIYSINPDAAHIAAVSVREGPDGPALSAAWSDLTGAVRGQVEHPVDLLHSDPVTVVAAAVSALFPGANGGPGRAQAAQRRLARVQLAVAGSFDPATRAIHHVDLPGFDRPGLADALTERIGAPVDIDNDANLATVAERRHGCARHADGFALMWLGEGLGLGIDLGGTLLRGARGGAGEIGYMPLNAGDRGRSGIPTDLQDLIGRDAVRALAAQHGHAGCTSEEIVQKAAADPEFLTAFADRVAVGLAAVVAVLDPALVVLAGPVAKAGGVPLRDAVVAALRRAAPLETTVEVTAVNGDPVVLGGLDAALSAVRDGLVADLRHASSS